MRALIRRAARLSGSAQPPGDKSISHRAWIFSALASGTCAIDNLSPGEDVRSTAACLRALGVSIDAHGNGAVVRGVGLGGFRRPETVLDCGNSGTTMRLLAGVVAGAGVGGVLDGDASLRGRPMKRVLEPLRQMGARCEGTRSAKGEETAPLRFDPGVGLTGVRHELTVASAQVKTCLLLAGLFADGETTVREPEVSRDHTERMLKAFGAPLTFWPDRAISIRSPAQPLRSPASLTVPGDPSSAAFLLAAALVVPGGAVTLTGVDVNPTRIGFLRVLQRMGAQIELLPEPDRAGDPVATLKARGGGQLTGTEITPGEVPSLLDEVPILAVVASQAKGRTVIRGAQELRVKESDRLAKVAAGLAAMGVPVQELPDGLIIDGPVALQGARIDAARDHRIAMSFSIAGLCAAGNTEILGAEWADISDPGFYTLLSGLTDGSVTTSP
jgi:3-phosphoshikimate 1-carboxyvinyltransferase